MAGKETKQESKETLDVELVVELEVELDSIIFKNDTNGYKVFSFTYTKEEKKKMDVGTGVLLDVNAGDTLLLTGKWGNHKKYGKQFAVDFYEQKMPKSEDEIESFLASGAIEGISKQLAKTLSSTYGEKIFDIMEKDHKQLIEIKGISAKIADKIHESYCKQMGSRQLLTFLSLHKLPLTLAAPLTQRYGEIALAAIQNNPFIMMAEDGGLNFSQADQLARSLGKSQTDSPRLEAGLLACLHQTFGDGHTFLPKPFLFDSASQLLQCSMDLLEEPLELLLQNGEVYEMEIMEHQAIYLSDLYASENNVALRMLEMSTAELLPPSNLNEIIEKIQKDQEISYSPQQEEAVAMAAKHQVMLLTGGPGTGKTTSLKGVLALFEALDLETVLTAPTGRAAQRLGELCGREASTIHRLLEIGVSSNSGKLSFHRNSDEPLTAKAVIVDETSMVDISLMSCLLEAISNDCRLILVGDPDQLPSVGPGTVFYDLIQSNQIPMVRLNQIFRQAQESNIVQSAHLVNKGEMPSLSETQGDFFFLPRHSSEMTVQTIVDICAKRLPQKGFTVDQIQVLSPTRKHGTGTASLNFALQEALNPPSDTKGQREFGSWTFREGDRVMQVKNNYDISWKELTGSKTGKGVFNGDIGTVKKVDSRAIVVHFEDKKVEYTTDLLLQLEPAFAITVHKAQGSEYPAVVFAAFDGAPMLLNRGILYTGITRAKSFFIAVGSPHVISEMSCNESQNKRYSGLKQRLLSNS